MWRKYGGSKQFSKEQNVTTTTLVCKKLILQDAYQGDFNVNGALSVKEDTFMNGSIDVCGSLLIAGSASFLSDISCVSIAVDNLAVSQDTRFSGALSCSGPLYANNLLQLDPSCFLYSPPGSALLGVNKLNPISTLDIEGDTATVLSLRTTLPITRNILAATSLGTGASISVNQDSGSIDFYLRPDKSVDAGGPPDAALGCDSQGLMQLLSTDLQLNTRVSISPTGESAHPGADTLVVYDGGATNIPYGGLPLSTGISIAAVGRDNARISLLSSEGRGWEKIGGVNASGQQWSLSAYVDVSGELRPVLSSVSNSDSFNCIATTSVNSYGYADPSYALTVNGPQKVGHVVARNTQQLSFESTAVSSYEGLSILVGSPSNSESFEQRIYVSKNSGSSWTPSVIDAVGSDIYAQSTNFTATCVYDSNIAFVGGVKGFIYVTGNGGVNWFRIFPNFALGTSVLIDILSLACVYKSGNTISLYVAGRKYGGNTSSSVFAGSVEITKSAILVTTGNPLIPDFVSANSITLSTFYNSTLGICCGPTQGNNVLLFGEGKQPGNSFLAMFTPNMASLVAPGFSVSAQLTKGSSSGSSLAAVCGVGVIWATITGGVQWISSSFPGLNFVDIIVRVASDGGSMGVAIASNGSIAISKDIATWSILTPSFLSLCGNQSILSANPIVCMAAIDDGTFVFGTTVQSYIAQQTSTNQGQTTILVEGVEGTTQPLYLYVPSLFSSASTTVLDVQGATSLGGAVILEGPLQSSKAAVSLFDTSASRSISIGNSSTTVKIGGLGTAVNVSGSFNLSGNIRLTGSGSIYAKTILADTVLPLNETSVLINQLFVGSSLTLSGAMQISNQTRALARNTGAVLLDGNAGLGVGGNVFVRDTIYGRTLSPSITDLNGAGDIRIGSWSPISDGDNVIQTGAYTSRIYIGNSGDTIILGAGEVLQASNQVAVSLDVNAKTFTINKTANFGYTSFDAGMNVKDNGIDDAGYIHVNKSMNGYDFKAPMGISASGINGVVNNIVSLDVNGLVMPSGSSAAVMVLRPSLDASASIGVSSVSVDALLLRDVSNSSLSLQKVGTALSVSGSLSALSSFSVSGDAIFAGIAKGVRFSTVSDYRVKYDVCSLSHATLDELRPLEYTNALTGGREMGFLAHEVQHEFPMLVLGERDGPEFQSLNYIGMIALLVEEVQRLKHRVSVLEVNREL